MARILIVDDDPQFRRVLRIALLAKGHEVREAASGADALTIVSTDTPQLALVDWQMPGLDGLQTCRAIHRSSDIPVIMVTAKNQSDREEALAAGAVDYVTKPFEFDYLMTRVEFALSH